MIRICTIVLIAAAAAPAQQTPAPAAVSPGTPLRVVLEEPVRIRRAGDPVRAKLADPVYVFDRAVLPAGTLVEGQVAEIGGVPAGRRVRAILSGNFTPRKDVRARFDTLVLGDGSRLPLETAPSRGMTNPVLAAKGRKLQGPGKAARLKSALLAMLPYQRQSWQAGTLFNAVLQEPLTATASATAAPPEGEQVAARLVTPLSSATAARGTPVEAIVTRPQFSPDHRLLIPEGSRLIGEVVEARAARRLHRNGKLLFVFRRVELPGSAAQSVQGYVEGVEAEYDAHLALDSEGAARVQSPKSRFIFPAVAAAAAGLSLHQDVNAQGVPDQDIAGRAEAGAVGLGLIGTVLAQTSRTAASGIAFSGAGFSLYQTFIARGQDVVLPANTAIEVSLRARPGQ